MCLGVLNPAVVIFLSKMRRAKALLIAFRILMGAILPMSDCSWQIASFKVVCNGLTPGQCYALNSKALQITTTQIVA